METRKYPSQSELESWREAARQHIVSLAQQTDAEVHAYIHQLIQTVTAYEAREGWVVSSPESIERYLTRPLLTIDYDNPLWREQFLHAHACLYLCRTRALGFRLGRDVLDYLIVMPPKCCACPRRTASRA
jgi:hypothetical protein